MVSTNAWLPLQVVCRGVDLKQSKLQTHRPVHHLDHLFQEFQRFLAPPIKERGRGRNGVKEGGSLILYVSHLHGGLGVQVVRGHHFGLPDPKIRSWERVSVVSGIATCFFSSRSLWALKSSWSSFTLFEINLCKVRTCEVCVSFLHCDPVIPVHQ